MEEHNMSGTEIETPLARRVKPVSSREVPDGHVTLHAPPAAPPPAASPALEHLRDPTAPPAIDPTQALGRRRRKRSYHTRYRLSQLLVILSIAGSILGIIAVGMEDPLLARIVVVSAVACGLLSVATVWNRGNDLSSRMTGFGASATILACITAAFVFLAPPHWFAEKSPEQKQQEMLTPSSSARNKSPK